MGYSTVDDMSFADAATERIQAGMHLGQHPFADRAFLDHPLHVFARDRGEVASIGIANTLHIGHHHQLFRTERGGHRSSHEIGINVVSVPFTVGADWRDDGNVIILLEFPY